MRDVPVLRRPAPAESAKYARVAEARMPVRLLRGLPGAGSTGDGRAGARRSVMHITVPKLSLVVLIGPSGSGKSTFARKHFLPTEILSSDVCRGMVSDDENNQAVTNDAF